MFKYAFLDKKIRIFKDVSLLTERNYIIFFPGVLFHSKSSLRSNKISKIGPFSFDQFFHLLFDKPKTTRTDATTKTNSYKTVKSKTRYHVTSLVRTLKLITTLLQ